MDFKEIFLKLTEYTIPFKHEVDVAYLLPEGIKKDPYGNYHMSIGNSTTLFTAHLDNHCKKKIKVNHIIDGNIIKTDGKTILGGDNKAGVCVLLYLISKNVPGTYYFFLGEESPVSGGLWGSTKLLVGNPGFLKKFDRAVAFDRREKGSIIVRQAARNCCSDTFAEALILEFRRLGIRMEKDKTGYYTDTGNFIDVISECTNISVGVWNEHHKNEYVDISYVEKIATAAAKINWESLPSVRKIGPWMNEIEPTIKTKYSKFTSKKDKALFKKVLFLLCEHGPYLLMNRFPFEAGKEMWFNQWFEEAPIKVVIENDIIKINDKIWSLSKLEKLFKKPENQ